MSTLWRSIKNRRLKRLDPLFYRGLSYVHWTISMQGRSTGWLNQSHYVAVRELLLNTCARWYLCCPVFCLMPDHGHFLFVGLEERADQLPAMAWFRREWNGLLNPHKQQDQAYDSVLKEDDRKADGVPDLVAYILRNPIRKDLTENWSEWPYSGCVFPGYPKLDPRKDFFWDNFWTAYYRQNGMKN